MTSFGRPRHGPPIKGVIARTPCIASLAANGFEPLCRQGVWRVPGRGIAPRIAPSRAGSDQVFAAGMISNCDPRKLMILLQ